MLGFEARDGTEQLPLLRKDAMGGSQSSAASDASFTPLRSDRDDATAAAAADDAADGADEAYDPNKQMVSLLKPVSLTMVLVVYLVRTLGSPESLEGGLSELMVYQELEADSASTKAGGVLLNALAMVAMLAVVTTLMMLLYRYRCYKLMYGWLLFSVASLLFSFGGLVLEQVRVSYPDPYPCPYSCPCPYPLPCLRLPLLLPLPLPLTLTSCSSSSSRSTR